MNPTDFLLLVASIIVATMSVGTRGWGVHGLGPAILVLAGGVWLCWLQWLRHRSWLRHRDDGGAPGTQHLAIWAVTGNLLLAIVAMAWLMTTLGR